MRRGRTCDPTAAVLPGSHGLVFPLDTRRTGGAAHVWKERVVGADGRTKCM